MSVGLRMGEGREQKLGAANAESYSHHIGVRTPKRERMENQHPAYKNLRLIQRHENCCKVSRD